MYLTRLLQINMATLAALGALLLGMGQRSEGPPLLVALAAVTSVWLTDITGWFRLGRRTANVLMIVATIVSLRQLFPLASEVQALGFAWFLIYLQILLLFQQKDTKTYWLLIVLSLLQVVVATLFSQGFWFGVLLAIYMLLGFLAMTLLLLYQQWQRYRPADKPASEPVSASGERRWSLIGQQANFICLPGGSAHAGVCRDLFGWLGRMSVHTLALTAVLFLAVPRFGQVAWRGALSTPQSLVGFSDEVTLGELGQIIESRDEVMRVRFFDHRTNAPQPVQGEIYLQGALLMTYQQGQWQAGDATTDVGSQVLERIGPLPSTGLVRQEIAIEGLDRDELFYVAPYVPLVSNADVRVDLGRERLQRAGYRCSRQFRYKLGTTAIVDGRQQPLTPTNSKEMIGNTLAMPNRDGADALPNLVALAGQWIAESGLPSADRIGRARCLERRLAGSGRFQYSLIGQSRDPDIDPIEDFVTKHPEGHCEYFATALTLMLRSQDIPARMVVGYKCDEWNSVGGFYQVRQLHAHTWVEAYLPPGDVPPALMHGGDYWPWSEGGWLRLDPTPAGADAEEKSGMFASLHGAMDWLDFAWSNYVVEMNSQRQRDSIYEPIGRALKDAASKAVDPARWRAMFDAIIVALHLDQISGVAAWLLAVGAGIVAVAMLAGIGWMLWRIGRRLYARWTESRFGQISVRWAEVDFYRRLELLLARQGIRRAAGQTQREFAETAGLQLALASGEPRLTMLPQVVAEAFYRVRFGQQPLDNVEAQAVEQALTELTAWNRKKPTATQIGNAR